MITVVELPEFRKTSADILSEEERRQLINYLAAYPESGDLIIGSGGIRKLRWYGSGRGKRGGSRVIYFFYNNKVPLFILTLFTKNVKINLSKSEIAQFKKLTDTLLTNYGVDRK